MDLPPGVVIRPATKDDIPSLARVHVQCWREAYSGMVDGDFLGRMNAEGWTRVWNRTFEEGVSGKPELERHFVAEDPRAGIVGFSGCGPSRHAQLKYDGELYGIYVLGNYQGMGIGRGLTAKAVEFLEKHRYGSMVLWVLEANTKARKFYETLGGNLVGVKSTVKISGKDYDEIAYSWSPLSGLSSLLSSRPLP